MTAALRIARRELGLITGHPALLGLTVLLPLALLALLAAVFIRGIPGDLPFAVVDLDRSETSRSLSRMLEATPELSTLPAATLTEASDAIRGGTLRGALLIPEGFERDLTARRRPELALFTDNQHMTAGAIAARGARAAVTAFVAGEQAAMLGARGLDADAVAALVTPIPMQAHALFNPTLSYIDFLLSALVPAVVQVMAAAAMAYALALDLGRPVGPDRPPMQAARPGAALALARQGGSVGALVVGKLMPYAAIFLAVIGLADIVLVHRLGVPMRGSLTLLAAGAVLFVVASALIGALAVLLTRDFGVAISLVAIIVAPAFGYMGAGFPREAMPPLAQLWSSLLPGTWYLELRIDQTLRATPPDLSLRPLLALLGQVAVLSLAVLALAARKRREVLA